MSAQNIKLIPFTDEELTEVQATIVDRMLEIDRNIKAGNITSETGGKEIERLCHVSEKFSKYSKHS